MTKEEAIKTIHRDRTCFRREGSLHCSLNPGCAGCMYFVSSEELEEARRVLDIKDGEAK